MRHRASYLPIERCDRKGITFHLALLLLLAAALLVACSNGGSPTEPKLLGVAEVESQSVQLIGSARADQGIGILVFVGYVTLVHFSRRWQAVRGVHGETCDHVLAATLGLYCLHMLGQASGLIGQNLWGPVGAPPPIRSDLAMMMLVLVFEARRRIPIMMILFAAANRVERRFDDPDRFDIHRNPQGHFGFGYGIHFCLGAALARLEARVTFETLFSRCRNLRLDADEIPLIDSLVLRGPKSIPLIFDQP